MTDVEINDVAKLGSVRDVEGYMLPPEAWTLASNVRISDQAIEKLGGQEEVFQTPGAAPHFAMPVQTQSNVFWLWTTLVGIFVWNGSAHTSIGDIVYTTDFTRRWNGTLFGGIPILNNFTEAPRYWPSISTATIVAPLTNWTSTHRAKVMRSYGNFLIGLNITKSGSNLPHRVKWSHPADPGTLPVSWDEADPTRLAGEVDLADVTSGVIQDGLPLRGSFYIYKEGSIWRMTFVGGTYVMNFDSFSETTGALCTRAISITGDGLRHVFATRDDICVHDGRSITSVLEGRHKKYLQRELDDTNYVNSFMYTNSAKNEVCFCFPESGAVNPTRQLIWNYVTGGVTEAACNFRNATEGPIESVASTTWATATATWSTYLGTWAEVERRRLIACATDTSMFLKLDSTNTNDGVAFTAVLQRTGLAMTGRKRTGEWIVDTKSRKLLTRIWVKAQGGPISVRAGFAETTDGTIVWQPAENFNPTTQRYVDIVASGMLMAIEFSSDTDVAWRLLGYKPEISPMEGEF